MLDVTYNRNIRYLWPGEGKDCGRRGSIYRACPSLAHWVRAPNSCHRRDCPEHWRDWLREESAAAAERVQAAGRQRWQHVVISFGGGYELARDSEARTREHGRVLWALRFCGFTGGAVVAHSARAHTKAERDVHTGDGGAHFHALCSGWCDPERVLALSEYGGIVVVAFGRDYKGPYQRFQYMLSHAALPVAINPARTEGTTSLHAITYWGILAYNKLKIPEKCREIYCPGCEAWFEWRSWHDLRVLGEPPDKEWGDLNGKEYFEPADRLY